MIRIALAAVAFPTAALIALSHAEAQPPMALQSQIFVEQVRTDINGRANRVLSVPGQIAPGDRLVFILRYRNAGRAALASYAVTNPVPPTLKLDAVQDDDMLVSVDGGRNWGKLGVLAIATPLGGTRRATADDVTHIRWPIDRAIPPGSGGQISYRATVR